MPPSRFPVVEWTTTILTSGSHAGLPVFRVTLAGTPAENSESVSLDDMLETIEASPLRVVAFSGLAAARLLSPTVIDALHARGKTVFLDTDGTARLAPGIDWVTLYPRPDSPVVAGYAHEVCYTLRNGEYPVDLPLTPFITYLAPDNEREDTLRWCLSLLFTNPSYRLTVDMRDFLDIP